MKQNWINIIGLYNCGRVFLAPKMHQMPFESLHIHLPLIFPFYEIISNNQIFKCAKLILHYFLPQITINNKLNHKIANKVHSLYNIKMHLSLTTI